MPFGPIMSPAIGLSLLKARLTSAGIPSRIRYFSIRFAEMTGERFYTLLAEARQPALREMAGEWIFSEAFSNEHEESYVEEILRRRGSWGDRSWTQRPIAKRTIEAILRARRRAPQFLDACAAELAAARPRIVGFTSTFQQHAASLGLARRIKERLPEATILFGGANCESVMGAETVRSFPFVDAAVSGEGEMIFPSIVRRLLDGQPIDDLRGVVTRGNVARAFEQRSFPNAPAVANLDELPYPDYSDFCEQWAQSRFERGWEPTMFFETSRGCWWGEKSHCTFCGLNGTSMGYRSKSASRALDELSDMATRYRGWDIQVTDNILDLRYFNDFIPALAERKIGLGLFYETKANLRKDQLRLLRQANIRGIQPGIESLSDTILTMMRKGVSGLQNIQLLKWCKELGITTAWNVLWGFPGEPPEEYARMASVIPSLVHLPPPQSFNGIRMDRFSPNFFDAERLGFRDLTPLPAYRHIYDLPEEAIANLAYYFTFHYRQPQEPREYVVPFLRALRRWQRQHHDSDLFAVDTPDALLLWDLRSDARMPLTVLRDRDRELYRSCDAAAGIRQLAATHTMSESEIADRLDPLVEKGFMVGDPSSAGHSRYLALAVPLGDYVPAPEIAARFRQVARDVAKSDRRVRLKPGKPRRSRARRDRSITPSTFTVQGEHVLIH